MSREHSLRALAGARAQRVFVGTMLGLPDPIVRRLAGPAIVRDGQTLDARVQLMIKLAAQVHRKEIQEYPPPVARVEFKKQLASVAAPMPPAIETQDRFVDVAGGRIAARIYSHASLKKPSPTIVYFHGGGFVVGDLESHDDVCAWLSIRARAKVLAIDYRLSPEHPFPAATDDALAAYRWVLAEADSLGVDASRLAVAGDSAGGNLSAVLCQDAKTAGLPLPCAQALLYPATDMHTRHPSRATFGDGFLLTTKMIDWFQEQYLAGGGKKDDPRVSPLLGKDLRGLPAAMVVTAGFDPLRDEGRAYAGALEKAGVRVVYQANPGLPHGFVSFAHVIPAARRALEGVARFLANELGT